jgi:hypothetical protein
MNLCRILVFLLLVAGFQTGSALAQTNASVGRNAATAPSSTTQVGGVDASGNLQPASAANPLPVSISGSASSQPAPLAVTPTDRGGTITTGGTSQTLAAANASRKVILIQNPCNATEDLYVSSTGAATTTGANDDADLGPCGSTILSPSGTVIQTAITVIAVTTGHRFLAKESQ